MATRRGLQVLASEADVALLDIEMPGLDGIAATVAVREQALLPGAGGHHLRASGLPAPRDGRRRERVHGQGRPGGAARRRDPAGAGGAAGRRPVTRGGDPGDRREPPDRPGARRSGWRRGRAAPLRTSLVPSSLSEGTVRNYLSAAISKTRARTRAEAVRLATEQGWLDCGCAGRQWRGDDRMAAAGAGGRARRARADGRHHEPRVPPPGARAGPSGPRRRHRRRGWASTSPRWSQRGPWSSATPRPSRWSRRTRTRARAASSCTASTPPSSAMRCGCSSTRTAPTTST